MTWAGGMLDTDPARIGTPVRSRSGLSWTRSAYLAAVIVTGAIVLAFAVVRLVSDPFPPMWFALALLTLGTGWATIRMPGFPISVSLSDTFTMAAALLFGPAAGALLASADGLVMSMKLARESQTAPRLLFNMTAPALAMWLAASVFFHLVAPRAPIGRIALGLTV